MLRKTLLLVFFLPGLSACHDTRCKDNTASLIRIKAIAGPGSASALYTEVKAIGSPGYTSYPYLVQNEMSFTRVYLSLHQDSSAFVLSGPQRQDTLVVRYSRREYFISDNCGMGMEIKLIRAELRPSLRHCALENDSTIAVWE